MDDSASVRGLLRQIWGGVVIAGAVALLACSESPSETRSEMTPASEPPPAIRLNAEAVPVDLRDLIPFAEQWGIGDDVIRSDVEEKASEAERQRFKAALTGRTAAVTVWLDSFPQAEPMSDEAAAFMYMLEALDEMQLWPD